MENEKLKMAIGKKCIDKTLSIPWAKHQKKLEKQR
jgi:hypothetical protein